MRAEVARGLDELHARWDRVFGGLIVAQWAIAVAYAARTSAWSWRGAEAHLHPHLIAASLGGAVCAAPVVLLAWARPGGATTRYAVAVAQAGWSAIFLTVSGGDAETHYHLFGSLAFLAFYRDPGVLAVYVGVLAGDRAMRGALWPEGLYGAHNPGWGRSVEEVAWLSLEALGLCLGIRQAVQEMEHRAEDRAEEEVRRSNIEAELRAALEAASVASTAKSQFLAGMSHELRTPLNVVIGYSEMLLEEVGDDAQRADLNRILDSGRHLLALIDQVLDLSRVEAGRMEWTPQVIDLGALAADVARVAEPLVWRNQNRLVLAAEGGPLSIVADPLRVRQIVLNLLSNAAKFTDHGVITLTVATDGASVMVSVSDTGIGMDAQMVARLFRPFSQGDQIQRRFGGTGLGLALSRRLAEVMGGRIDVQSEPGKGTAFAVAFPAATVGASRASA